MTGVLPIFPERRKRQHAFVWGTQPNLKPSLTFPKGRNKLLLLVDK
mgnify:CR=1 FL=1